MPEPAAAGAAADAGDARWLCAGDALAERGRAVVFDLTLWGQPARGFALRIDGRVVGYVNRCAHVPVEMDWQPGHFLDAEGRFIICSIHGATYDPASGQCIGGPGGRGRLLPVRVAEVEGQVYWYPSRDIRPVAQAAMPPARPA